MPIITKMREKEADCHITLGGGNLTDGAKIMIFVRSLIGYHRQPFL